MKVLKILFPVFLLLFFISQLAAENHEEKSPQVSSSEDVSCKLSMACRTSSATASMPKGNYCYVVTVSSETPEYLYIGYDHCMEESETPVTSLSITLCFGPDSCGPTIDTNTNTDDAYHVFCGVQSSSCLEGCDVIVGNKTCN